MDDDVKEKHIASHKGEQTTALCIDTIKLDKQALVFCASKRAAESQAEKVAKQSKELESGESIAEKALHALSQPTHQCKRLAYCLKRGIAFHHAGLPSAQRELIETEFRKGTIRIICSTPTLAAGLDLPAFRTIIRDHKRFSGRGMTPIPVLEYLQMAGRAGRPGQEDYGEAILSAGSPEEVERLTETYIHGIVEDIYSKLAVEPVLRTYILSLVATSIITTRQELNDFFRETFYARQFGNMRQIETVLAKMVSLLRKWGFLEHEKDDSDGETGQASDMFVTASELTSAKREKQGDETLIATPLGKRVSEIYLDPLTAHVLLEGMKSLEANKKPKEDEEQAFAVQHLISCSLEMRPLLRMRVSTTELIENKLSEQRTWLVEEADFYEYSQDDYEDTILTACFLNDWAGEASEQYLLDKYGIRPGEITVKLQRSEWLLYACEELARVTKKKELLAVIRHISMRTKHGVRSELIPLLQFKGIGRSRARKLHAHGMRTIADVKNIHGQSLSRIIGPKTARALKEQAGEDVDEREFSEEKIVTDKPERTKNKQTSLGQF
ncbi:MAG: helicase-related protein [Nanoarchaeota archaeon]